MQLNAPVAFVVNDPVVQLEMVTLSKTSPTVLDTEKPDPVTVTVDPMVPLMGFTEIRAIVVVKVAVAV